MCGVTLGIGRKKRQTTRQLIPSEVMDRLNQFRGVFEFGRQPSIVPRPVWLLALNKLHPASDEHNTWER